MGGPVAILGASGHVAKNLIVALAGTRRLSLFARSPAAVSAFLDGAHMRRDDIEVGTIDAFSGNGVEYGAIVNCVGVGTPEKVRTQGAEVQCLTEQHDNLVLRRLDAHPATVYVNFSSGAVYGTDGTRPADHASEFRIGLGAISAADVYRVSKLNSETKHRAFPGRSIVDLRLFSLFSRFIDLGSSYLVTEMVKAVKRREEFVTDSTDVVRDFVHPTDLGDMVARCLDARGTNRAFDVYSRSPARKSELVAAFQQRFGLKVRLTGEPTGVSPTGAKSYYASGNRDAEAALGYVPRYTSIEAVLAEAEILIEGEAG